MQKGLEVDITKMEKAKIVEVDDQELLDQKEKM